MRVVGVAVRTLGDAVERVRIGLEVGEGRGLKVAVKLAVTDGVNEMDHPVLGVPLPLRLRVTGFGVRVKVGVAVPVRPLVGDRLGDGLRDGDTTGRERVGVNEVGVVVAERDVEREKVPVAPALAVPVIVSISTRRGG